MFLLSLRRFRGHGILTSLLGPDAFVVDGGAHRGEFSREIHLATGARCFLVEANPQLYAALKAPPSGQTCHAALGARDGSARFHFDANPEGGSIVSDGNGTRETPVEVPALGLATLLRDAGETRIDLLKLDIEGAEFALLEETPVEILEAIQQITVEFHEAKLGGYGPSAYERVCARLAGLGFARVGLTFRGHGDVLFLNRRRVRMRAVDLLALRWLGRWCVKARERFHSSKA